MSEIEAVGDAVTGGVLGARGRAGAGEVARRRPHARSQLPQLRHPAGRRLIATRAASTRMSTARLTGFFHDLLHGVFHFEGKIWRTLPLLAWRPGELTRRYIDGQRARFVSPIALFLFSVFLMFAVLSLTGDFDRSPTTSAVSRAMAASAAKDEANCCRAGGASAPGWSRRRRPTAGSIARIADSNEDLSRDARRWPRDGDRRAIGDADRRTLPGLDPRAGRARPASNPELLLYKLQDQRL